VAEDAALTVGIVGGVTVTGAVSPANEMEQVYYLGVFDPEEQLPPSMYRVRVHGQSSILSSVRFASGWVPAGLIDSLSGQTYLDPNGTSGPVLTGPATSEEADLAVGRRLWMFGPEGFRTAPPNHRLVIVMSSDPSKYFDAIDQTLGLEAGGAATATNTVQPSLLSAYQDLLQSRERLDALRLQTQSIKP
jgi:hypothetical protein